MPTPDKTLLVGEPNPKPEVGRNQRPVNLKKLMGMSPEARSRAIVRRANYIIQNNPFPSAMSWDYLHAIWYPESSGMIRPERALVMQYKKLQEWFPHSEKEMAARASIDDARRRNFPSPESAILNMEETLKPFKETSLCHRLVELVRPIFEKRKCDKIVAFGMVTFGPPAAPVKALTVRWTTQHASLIVIREIWEECNKRAKKPLQIYLQDPQYWEQDVEVAKHFGMTVVNAGMCHHMGWVHIDESTLVCESSVTMAFPELLMEIARPIAILASGPWEFKADIESHADQPYTLTVMRPKKLEYLEDKETEGKESTSKEIKGKESKGKETEDRETMNVPHSGLQATLPSLCNTYTRTFLIGSRC
ncbi:hypothetical protein IFR05_009421 [Cadophora sp. M221]|nr:hypothetical protein IFR05_009421 [Cadophora sp. M221]